MKSRVLLWLAFSTGCLVLNSIRAEASPYKRSVLILYNSADSSQEIDSTNNQAAISIEVFLNHLGLVVDYRDVKEALPGQEKMSEYRGVISVFFGSSIKHPLAYLDWAERQLKAGRRFVILGNLGAFSDSETKKAVPISRINRFLNMLGVDFKGNYNKKPDEIELVYKDPRFIEFERSLAYESSVYECLQPVKNSLHSYLTLKLIDQPGSDSFLVATGDRGGYVWGMQYLVYSNKFKNMQKLRLNPYLFFQKALGLKGKPRLDVTTLCGRRIYYSNIDGDGLSGRAFFNTRKTSAEIIRDRVIKKYPDLPVGVSFIAGEIEYNKEPERIKKIAASIFDLKNVEPASHSYSHPLVWKKGVQAPSTPAYSFDRIKFSLFNEIVGSINYLNRTLLENSSKKVRIIYWSGDCQPPEEAFKIAAENHILNINGGDTRKDLEFPSYTTVCPLSAQLGKYRQIYSSNSNENTYTDLWRGPYFGFRQVKATWKATDSPFRLQPINLYYHFYSGERTAALNALISNVEYVVSVPVNPVFPTRFAEIVLGFFSGSIEELAGGGYRFSRLGECRTVRFDQGDKKPDWERCRGVMGYTTHNGRLYLALDPAVAEPVVYLTDSPKDQAGYLIEAGCRIRNWKATESGVSFRAEGFGEPAISIHTRRKGRFAITRTPLKGLPKTFNQKSDHNVLTFRLPLHQLPYTVKINLLN
ncbi:MAG: hypothetical protein ACE5GM_04715 [bacterium]